MSATSSVRSMWTSAGTSRWAPSMASTGTSNGTEHANGMPGCAGPHAAVAPGVSP